MDSENNNASSLFSAAMMEKARAHIQMWGRTAGNAPGANAIPYNPAELHALLLSGGGQQVYMGQRVPLGLPSQLWSHAASGGTPWQSPMHGGLPPGFLGPPQHPPQQQQQLRVSPPPPPQTLLAPPPPSSTPSSSSGSPSPTSISSNSGGVSADIRLPKALFPAGIHRFSPYASSVPRNANGLSPIARSTH